MQFVNTGFLSIIEESVLQTNTKQQMHTPNSKLPVSIILKFVACLLAGISLVAGITWMLEFFIPFWNGTFSFIGRIILYGFIAFQLDNRILSPAIKSSFDKADIKLHNIKIKIVSVSLITSFMLVGMVSFPLILKQIVDVESVYDIPSSRIGNDSYYLYRVQSYDINNGNAISRYYHDQIDENNAVAISPSAKKTEIYIDHYIPVTDTANHKTDPQQHQYWLHDKAVFLNSENVFIHDHSNPENKQAFEDFVESLVSFSNTQLKNKTFPEVTFFQCTVPDENLTEIVGGHRINGVMLRINNSNIEIMKFIMLGGILIFFILSVLFFRTILSKEFKK